MTKNCLKPCTIRQFTLEPKIQENVPKIKIGKRQFDIFLTGSNIETIQKEYLVYDILGVIGSIGGSMGLFFGFSFFDSFCFALDFITKRLKMKLIRNLLITNHQNL